jgi:UDP-glucuronate 4-epimerase
VTGPKAKRILITGTAGFIGFHLAKRLLRDGHEVMGIDNINPYYDIRLKQARLAQLSTLSRYTFQRADLVDRDAINRVFADFAPEIVVNLAAQAGVRHSLTDPHAYVDSNITGFLNILEACRHYPVEHLAYASSSSVYGANTKMPFSVHDNVDHPVSLYAASKKANELMAHSYSHLYGLSATGLRFFTVYGPWGRPDMALFIFTQLILAGEPIQVFNHGIMQRDFTYIDDIVEGVARVALKTAVKNPKWSSRSPDPATSYAPHRIYNIGNNEPVPLLKMIEILEDCLGQKAEKNFLPMQPGDVPATYADIDNLVVDLDFRPMTTIEDGVKAFVDWYLEYYGTGQ